MSAEEQISDSGEEATAETAAETPAAERTLNRAERRAQAKGKKGTSGAANPAAPHGNRMLGPVHRAATAANKTRFPRTGHK